MVFILFLVLMFFLMVNGILCIGLWIFFVFFFWLRLVVMFRVFGLNLSNELGMVVVNFFIIWKR